MKKNKFWSRGLKIHYWSLWDRGVVGLISEPKPNHEKLVLNKEIVCGNYQGGEIFLLLDSYHTLSSEVNNGFQLVGGPCYLCG